MEEKAPDELQSSEVRKDWSSILEKINQTGIPLAVMYYTRRKATILPGSDNLVVLRTADANQAARLLHLVGRHGAVGLPFPNNLPHGWRVVDADGNPVNLHAIPSVAATVLPTYAPESEPIVYTAAIATGSSVVAGDHCDVSVIRNEIFTYRPVEREKWDPETETYTTYEEEVPEYTLTGTLGMDPVELKVRTDDDEKLVTAPDEASEILEANGWKVTGSWEPADDVLYAQVERL